MQLRRGGSLRPLRQRPQRFSDDGTRARCSICQQEKPLSDFGPDSARGGQPKRQCKQCLSEYQKRWAKENPDYVRRTVLKRKGITPEEFDALLEEQGGRCAICRCEPRTYRAFAVDHCHRQNKNRGLLCQDCNMGLGQFKDDPALLRAAADYIEAHR